MNSSTPTTPPGGEPDAAGTHLPGPDTAGPRGGEAHDGEQYDESFGREVGVGPHPLPWPQGDRYDPQLLAHGDRRNVVDRYRYWTQEAVIADLDTRRHPFHVAVENWTHDFNIGSVVRTANAFLTEQVHIVGRRRWNRRGAMVTDRYQHIRHHGEVSSLAEFAAARDLPIIGIDNLPGAVPLETTELPRRCILLFGQEGPGLTEEAWKHSSLVCSIAQFGSTRSINAGAAAAIAMHSWIRTHAEIPGE
ncbi:TrmH family RNA methyltransferase [Peterkaempfera griseoplana]|uniref:TrmH family RNA methyltransferase n=1 Tax=Peterkaempfera griseoplana TaxID=66896 RepID=UPI0006E14DAE|nr:TrmH family RNA methyltransferase [Peterkaempfera griseoplana]